MERKTEFIMSVVVDTALVAGGILFILKGLRGEGDTNAQGLGFLMIVVGLRHVVKTL